MKKLLFASFIFTILTAVPIYSQEISPYILVGENPGSIEKVEKIVSDKLTEAGFEIIGNYHPENNQTLKVIVYSREDLQDVSLKIKDRGALAAALKVGLKSDGPGTSISYLNPEYLFQAYFMASYDTHSKALKKINDDVASALSTLGDKNTGFGGSMTAEELREYHYKMMMPYFTDPVDLQEFTSFEEGVRIIEDNLKKNKGKTKLVYNLTFPDHKVAVFGIGLMDEEEGEKEFLPIIGEAHLAALPYEIILQGTEATMLHGRYRLALHWPELSMGTFMKIRNTPGDIKDVFKALCE